MCCYLDITMLLVETLKQKSAIQKIALLFPRFSHRPNFHADE